MTKKTNDFAKYKKGVYQIFKNMITYQVQISLKKVTPKIWRRLLISSDLLLSDFHKVIQTSMGWTNSHLHQFISNEIFYTRRIAEDIFWDEIRNVDYKDMRVFDLLKNEKEQVISLLL